MDGTEPSRREPRQAASQTARDALLWLGIYLLAVTAPLFALLPGTVLPVVTK